MADQDTTVINESGHNIPSTGNHYTKIFSHCPENSALSESENHLGYGLDFEQINSNDFQNSAIAADSNTNNYYNKGIQNRYEEALYLNENNLSKEFEKNLIIFHIMYSCILLHKLASTLTEFMTSQSTLQLFIGNLSAVAILSLSQIFVYLYIKYYRTTTRHILFNYGLQVFFTIIFLVITESIAITSQSTSSSNHLNRSPVYILILIIISRDLFFNNKILCMVQGLTGILIQIIIYMISIYDSILQFTINISLIVLVIVYLMVFTCKLDKKQKLYFNKIDCQRQTIEKFEKNRSSEVSPRSDTTREKMMSNCKIIQFVLQQMKSLSLSGKMENELNDTMKLLNEIKEFLLDLPIIAFNEVSIMLKPADESLISKASSLMSAYDDLKDGKRGIRKNPDEFKRFFDNSFDFFMRDWNFDPKVEQTRNLFEVAVRGACCKFEIWHSVENWTGFDNFMRFINALENKYIENYYHNKFHAVDVLHSFGYLIVSSSLGKMLNFIEFISMITSCLGHDVGHPGKDNVYLEAENNDLCITYNDSYVLENMHCALIFNLIKSPMNNFLDSFNKSEAKQFRSLVINSVLGTNFSTYVETAGKLNCLLDQDKKMDYFNNDGKQFILSVALKCADVGHYAKNQELYCLWNDLLIKEYLDLESISEFDYVYKDEEYYNNNIKFINKTVLPLYESWNYFLSLSGKDAKMYIANINKNKNIKGEYTEKIITTAEGIQVSTLSMGQ